MTYTDLSDRELIQLLEGHSTNEVLVAMSTDMLPGKVADISDVFLEVMSMAEPEN